jgi:nucleoside-triphosphatase
MSNNFLITGRPGSGKTSVIKEAVEILRGRGFKPGGLYCPEIREGGQRLGFKMVDLMTGEERILAHVDQPTGPQVSKYRVNVENIDAMSELAIGRALREADFIVVDEIAPMEMHSDGFRRAVLAALDSPKPLLAVIHQRTMTGFIGAIKSMSDVRLFEVTPNNREKLPSLLAELVKEVLSQRR